MNPIDGIEARQQHLDYMGLNPFQANGVIKGFSVEKEVLVAMLDVMDHYVQAGMDTEEFRLYLGREPNTNVMSVMVVGVQAQIELTDYVQTVPMRMGMSGPCPPNCDRNSPIIR
jgi:hypothetical protein